MFNKSIYWEYLCRSVLSSQCFLFQYWQSMMSMAYAAQNEQEQAEKALEKPAEPVKWKQFLNS